MIRVASNEGTARDAASAQLVHRQRLELVDRAKHVYELDHAATKQVELPEDVHLVKVELLALGHLLEFFLREAVLVLVRLGQLEASF